MTKIRKRNKALNDLLRSKRNTKHEAKQGDKVSRARAKHLHNKEGVE